MHDPAVRFILGACLFLLLIVITPAQSLRCYECASDEPGCSMSANASTTYEKDCPGAIRCILFKLQYTFVFPRMFFRACLYEVDRACYKEGTMRVEAKGLYFGKGFYGYQRILRCLNKTRSEAHLPAPLYTKTEFPDDETNAVLKYKVFDTNLGNSWDRSYFDSSGGADLDTPLVQNLSCYSCEAEIPGGYYAFDQFKVSRQHPELPHCGNRNNDNTPIVECKGAYGCSAFWEVRNEIDDENGGIKTVSRVWRDCWYPGDQICLRYPYPHPPYGRASLSSKIGADEKSSCGKAYEKTMKVEGERPGNNVVWANVQKIQSWSKYNEYLQCIQNIRRERGIMKSTVVKMVKEESDKKDGIDAPIYGLLCLSSLIITTSNLCLHPIKNLPNEICSGGDGEHDNIS